MLAACLECGEKLRGRTDKKYCSDHCRNTYHNRMNKDRRNLLRRINNRLRKNYRILESFELREGKTTTSRTRLLQKGFDFDLFTSIYTTRKGTQYHFVYDLGYLSLKEGYYVIVKKEERKEVLRTSSSPR